MDMIRASKKFYRWVWINSSQEEVPLSNKYCSILAAQVSLYSDRQELAREIGPSPDVFQIIDDGGWVLEEVNIKPVMSVSLNITELAEKETGS